jgi:hypothetical protein
MWLKRKPPPAARRKSREGTHITCVFKIVSAVMVTTMKILVITMTTYRGLCPPLSIHNDNAQRPHEPEGI